nr:MAG TPA: pre-60S ribosomal subunit biogenesis, Nmd3, peptidyl transferase [Caudoviricetes sp.]
MHGRISFSTRGLRDSRRRQWPTKKASEKSGAFIMP